MVVFTLQSNVYCSEPSQHIEHDTIVALLSKCDEATIQELTNEMSFEESVNFIDYVLENPPLLIIAIMASSWFFAYFHENHDVLEVLFPVLNGL